MCLDIDGMGMTADHGSSYTMFYGDSGVKVYITDISEVEPRVLRRTTGQQLDLKYYNNPQFVPHGYLSRYNVECDWYEIDGTNTKPTAVAGERTKGENFAGKKRVTFDCSTLDHGQVYQLHALPTSFSPFSPFQGPFEPVFEVVS